MTIIQANSQHEAILNRLKQGKATAWQLHQLGIIAVSSRIRELRQRGFDIECTMQPRTNAQGKKIRIGIYTLHKPSRKD